MNTTQMISIAIIAVIVIIIVLAIILFVSMTKKGKKEENNKNSNSTAKSSSSSSNKKTTDFEQVKRESIFKFMDFDDVKDNMIIRKKGEQFVMVIQCKGINFDLMSEGEQIAVEEGFLQFLNTLRYPVQLYVQTRSLDLSSGVSEYKQRIDKMQMELVKIQQQIRDAKKHQNDELLERLEYQERSQSNVLEYAQDIVAYISRMSQNKNVLQQKTYVIINYYKAELGDLDLKANDINDLVFSELYTRVQTIISALYSAGVESEVLNSEELAELLYVAYNRDDSELLNFEQALEMQYDALYTTSEDVVQKKQEEISKKLYDEGIITATEAVVVTDIKSKIEKSTNQTKEKVIENAVETLEKYKKQFDPIVYKKVVDQIYEIVEMKYAKKNNKKVEEDTSNEVISEEKQKKKTTSKKTTSKKVKVTEE